MLKLWTVEDCAIVLDPGKLECRNKAFEEWCECQTKRKQLKKHYILYETPNISLHQFT